VGGCRKCGSKHAGGKSNCPLKMLIDKHACKRVAQFMAALGNMSNEDATKFLRNEPAETPQVLCPMRVGWYNHRSALIGMGMVNCNYHVYAHRMNRLAIIYQAESGPKRTSSRFSEKKNVSLSGIQTGGSCVTTFCWKLVKPTTSIHVICSSSTFHR
jgi:hypothetical protein